jgi:GT2 family glycosyltransferase
MVLPAIWGCSTQSVEFSLGNYSGDKVDLSFAILTWNSERYLERCLSSIDRVLGKSNLSYEVLVLDNGSKDGTPRLLSRLAEENHGRLVPYYEKTNTGTTRSRNRLFAAARGDYLCVMDSDVELASGVFDALIPLLARDNSLGIVVPRIVYPNGTWQKSFDRFPTLADKINRGFRLRAIEEREALQIGSFTQPFCIDYAISAFWIMPRDLLQTVGLLDERIFYAPEDVDFCLRVWKSGFRILYVPSVSVVHHTQEISRGWNMNWAKLSHVKGLAYYFIKHRYLLRRPAFEGQRGRREAGS